MSRTRTDPELGSLAFHIFAALSKANMSIDEMKNLGEHIYSNSPKDKSAEDFKKQSMEVLGKMKRGTVAKLFAAAKELDLAFPLPELPVAEVPAPAAPPAQTTAPAAPPAPTPAATPPNGQPAATPPAAEPPTPTDAGQ